MSKVYIFFADGFEDIEGLTVVDLMRRAGIDIQTVSIKETKEIKTSHGIHLLTDRTFGECDFSDADMLVIPGGMPGTKYLEEYKPLTDLLTGFYQKGGKERVGYLHILLLQGASRVPIVIASSCASCGFGTPRQPEA